MGEDTCTLTNQQEIDRHPVENKQENRTGAS